MQLSRVLLLLVAAVVLSLWTCLAAGKVVHLGQQGSFARAVAAGPLFVKFCRHNCKHCEKVKPIWDDLERHYDGETQLAQLDIASSDVGRELASKYDVEGTPTFLLFRDDMVYTYEGARDTYQSFAEFVEVDYHHPVIRFVKSPMWAMLIVIPVMVLVLMLCFIAKAVPYDGVEDFATQIGAYQPPADDEDATVLDPLVSGQSLAKRRGAQRRINK